MPYPAPLIAYAFIKKGTEEGQYLTQMKLQKMVYFAHGYHWAKYGSPLVEGGFEAWKFGPVAQSIYVTYKSFGSSPIKMDDNSKLDKELDLMEPSAVDAINYTWEATKNLSASVLSNWTHKKDSPWHKAYTPNEWALPISENDIKTYFTNLLFDNGTIHDGGDN